MSQRRLDGSRKINVRGGHVNARGVRFWPVARQTFRGVLAELERHGRDQMYALASGGKDSMYIVDNLAKIGKMQSVLHVKTNIGLAMTTDFLRDECKRQGWPLLMVEPPVAHIYASHTLSYGFPGPALHRQIMAKLKYHAMKNFALSADRKRTALISGVRKFESARRKVSFPHPITADGNLWFGAPAFWKSDKQVYAYVIKNGLRISPAYEHGFTVSGECMCGAFASRGEKMLIRKADPLLADYIEWLEDGVRRFGSARAKKYPTWGAGATMSDLESQQSLAAFGMESEQAEMLSCGSECGAGTMRAATDF